MKKRIQKYLAGEREGFSLVELIIVIAIMAILIGVVALAVLPNIQRSRESKDIQALDSIASAANAAIATTQATGSDVITIGHTTKVGTTEAGVVDNSGTGVSDKIQHAIFDTVAAGAGACESDAAKDLDIVLAYDVSSKLISVAYMSKAPSTAGKLTGAKCSYLDQDFAVTNSSS